MDKHKRMGIETADGDRRSGPEDRKSKPPGKRQRSIESSFTSSSKPSNEGSLVEEEVIKYLVSIGLSLNQVQKICCPEILSLFGYCQKQTYHSIRTTIVDEDDQVKHQIGEMVRDEYISVFIDDSSEASTNQNLSVLQACAPTMDQPVTLAVDAHEKHFTNKTLRELIEGVLTEHDIDKKKVSAFVSDNGGACPTACKN